MSHPLTTDEWHDLRRRKGIISLSAQDILNLLRLPEDAVVLSVRDNWLLSGVDIMICAPALEPVAEATAAPTIPVNIEYDEVLDVFRIGLELDDLHRR